MENNSNSQKYNLNNVQNLIQIYYPSEKNQENMSYK